jgi:hypothetical protein
MDEDGYVDFGIIETRRIAFYRAAGMADALIKYATGQTGDTVANNISIAADILTDLEIDYARDIANMKRRLANLKAGRAMDDNG